MGFGGLRGFGFETLKGVRGCGVWGFRCRPVREPQWLNAEAECSSVWGPKL